MPAMAFAHQLLALAPRGRVTWMLVALNIAAWLGAIAAGADSLHPTAAQLLSLGGNAASEVQQGQWWRLLTSGFMHIGPMHLALNMLGLLLVGPAVERRYGHWQFLFLYIGAALAGAAASLHFSANSGVSVGASAGVFGCAGALLTMLVRQRRHLPLQFGRRALAGIVLAIVFSLVQGLAELSAIRLPPTTRGRRCSPPRCALAACCSSICRWSCAASMAGRWRSIRFAPPPSPPSSAGSMPKSRSWRRSSSSRRRADHQTVDVVVDGTSTPVRSASTRTVAPKALRPAPPGGRRPVSARAG